MTTKGKKGTGRATLARKGSKVKGAPKAGPRKPRAGAGTSLLDAAAKVVAAADAPMRVGEMVTRAEARGWKPGKGKTPAATLSAAIGREIKAKGKEARFKKTAPGLYVAREVSAAAAA